jgi:hypothetical protein
MGKKRTVEEIRGELITLWHISQEVQTLIDDANAFLASTGMPAYAPGQPRLRNLCDGWRLHQLRQVMKLLFALRQDVAKELLEAVEEEGVELDELAQTIISANPR